MSLEKMLEMEKSADELVRQMSEDAKKASEIPEKQASLDRPSSTPIPGKSDSVSKEPATDGEKTQVTTGEERIYDRELELWKQRYLTLQSKYDAEVPRYAAEKRELKEENHELSSKIEDLQNKFRGLEENINTKQQSIVENSVVESLTEQLGSESVSNLKNFIASIVKEEITRYDKTIQDKVKTVESKVDSGTQKQALSEKQRYIRDLKLAMPDIYEKNANPDWKIWLTSIVPYSRGKSWQDLLDEAHAAYDVDGVMEIFNACPAFKNKNGNGKPKEGPPVEPPKRPGSSPVEEEKKYYSKKEYDQFYQDAARGKYVSDEKTYQKLDGEFTKAMLEGRIR